jgi:Putative mono-oxygenase ydhR
MITTLVQFQLLSPVSLAEATRRFEATAPKYQKLPGLIRKYYIRSEDGHIVGGVYLWQTREAAERLQRRMARTRRKALRRQASHHLVRQSGRRR